MAEEVDEVWCMQELASAFVVLFHDLDEPRVGEHRPVHHEQCFAMKVEHLLVQ